MAQLTSPMLLDSTGQAIVAAITKIGGRVNFTFGTLPHIGVTGTFYFAPDENDNTLYNGYVWDETAAEFKRLSSSVTVDSQPTNGSSNPVSSGGVYTELNELRSRIEQLES